MQNNIRLMTIRSRYQPFCSIWAFSPASMRRPPPTNHDRAEASPESDVFRKASTDESMMR
eukprot:m.192545 g.192545  ORF g.192545 m.192545 type:complete len:60 (-) comp17586_c2_seq11:2427-2606(-)